MRHNGLGELIITTPFLHHLRRCFPNDRISLLATPYATDLFKHCTDVDELLILERGAEGGDYGSILPALREMEFSRFFCPQDIESTAALGQKLDIPMRVGFSHGDNGQCFTHSVATPPEIPKTLKLMHLLSPFSPSIEGLSRQLHLFTSAEDVAMAARFLSAQGVEIDAGFIGLNVGGQAYKQWPLERVAEIGREVQSELGVPCIVFAGSEEEEEEIVALAGRIGGGSIAAYNLPLLQTAEILRRCRFVLTNDSGLSWLAASAGTPSIILFRASSSMAEYKPEGDCHLGIQCYEDPTDCTDKGIRSITAGDVRDGIQELQQKLKANAGGGGGGSSDAFFESYNVTTGSRAGARDNFKGPLRSSRMDWEFDEIEDYVQRILAGEVLLHRVRLDLARICRFRCPFCFSGLDKITSADIEKLCIPLDMLRTLFAQFSRLGVRVVDLYGGGEPTLHPDMPEIVRLLVESGARIRIISNACGLTAELRAALAQYRSHIDIMRFSLPGVSRDSHREMTRSNLFELITSSIQELAHELKRHEDAPEIGLYVPVFMALDEGEIATFLEYASRSGADWVFFREDTRSPSASDSDWIKAGSCAFPDVRDAVCRSAEAHAGFPVYYSTPVAVPNDTSVCYFQLTDMVFVYHSPARKLVMMRCEQDIPGGIAELPPEGAYRLIDPASLYSECEAQLRDFLSNPVQVCSRPDYCLAYRRNRRIEKELGVGAGGGGGDGMELVGGARIVSRG